MGRPVILYLHGFCSSPAGWKSRLLAAEMAAQGKVEQFLCPQLSPFPEQAIAQINTLLDAQTGPVTLLGSSLGGHYAHHLAETRNLKAILINPATVDRLDLGKFVGRHRNFHTNEAFTFTANDAEALRRQVRQPTAERYWLLLEKGDEVLDYRDAVSFYAGCRQTLLPGGDHSFTQFPAFIPQILEFAGIHTGL